MHVNGLTASLENVGHKLHIENFFSSPALLYNFHTTAINCYGNVDQIRMLKNFGQKMKLKQGDINTTVRGNLRTICGKDKQNINMLTNMHALSTIRE
jgi:hypothetical protein